MPPIQRLELVTSRCCWRLHLLTAGLVITFFPEGNHDVY
jgi:hypothetical protein